MKPIIQTLAALYPALAEEWDCLRNAPLRPDEISWASSARVWWTCRSGHQWQAVISNRSRQATKCPFCSGKRIIPENSLASRNLPLASEWHPTKNGDVTAEQVSPFAARKYWWRCKRGHEWDASVNKRAQGRGCPYCSRKVASAEVNLAVLSPHLAKEWHPTLNGDLTPETTLPKSNKTIWWRCANGHDWEASPDARQRSGCPRCNRIKKQAHLLERLGVAGESVLTFKEAFPHLLKEVDTSVQSAEYVGALAPTHNRTRVGWICLSGHRWRASPGKRSTGQGCPECTKLFVSPETSFAAKHPAMVFEWDEAKNGDLRPDQVASHARIKVWWKCERGHSWLTWLGSRTSNDSKCPTCNPKTSKTEIRVLAEIQFAFGTRPLWREKIVGYEADIVLPSERVVIEVDGYPWHDNPKVFARDISKTGLFTNAGYQVFRLRDERLPGLTGCVVVPLDERELLRSVKALVSVLAEHIEPQGETLSRINLYLLRSNYANDAEYRRIVELLPGPEVSGSLGFRYPEVAAEWDDQRNAPLTVGRTHAVSGHVAWWMCPMGHSWSSRVADRTTGGRTCPHCAGVNPPKGRHAIGLPAALVQEWHPTKNGDLSHQALTLGSRALIWWRCSTGHEWQSSVSNRALRKTKCPYCAGRRASPESNFGNAYPSVARLYDLEANSPKGPNDFTPKSEKVAQWKCERGHTWSRSIAKQVKSGALCRECARLQS